jgi:hypothetical protein
MKPARLDRTEPEPFFLIFIKNNQLADSFTITGQDSHTVSHRELGGSRHIKFSFCWFTSCRLKLVKENMRKPFLVTCHLKFSHIISY